MCVPQQDNGISHLSNFYELSEEDFYPPEDRRIFKSGFKDTKSYRDYVNSYFSVFENELFDN